MQIAGTYQGLPVIVANNAAIITPGAKSTPIAKALRVTVRKANEIGPPCDCLIVSPEQYEQMLDLLDIV